MDHPKSCLKVNVALGFICLLFLPIAFTNCTSGSSGNSSGSDEAPAAPLKINTAGWSDSPFISRDGQRLYFMYSRWDFAPWIKSSGAQMPLLAGPDRTGLNKSEVNPWDESDIFVSTKNPDGTWSEPVALGFNGAYGDASGMEFNNGNSFIWLRGNGSTNHLVTSTKVTSSTWGPVEDLGTDINLAGAIMDNPFITEDGNYLYFSSSRTGTVGGAGRDMWFSQKDASGTWTAPVNLGVNFNAAGDEDQPFIPNGGSSTDFYWNSASGLVHCVSNGSSCTSTTLLTFSGCDVAAEISIPDDGQTAYFGCGTISTGRVQIMYSEKQGDGSWGPAIPVD